MSMSLWLIMMPSYFMFLAILVLSSLVSVSSNSWIIIWAGLELNMLSMLPLMGNLQTGEVQLKYFVVQSLGSAILLMGSLTSFLLSGSLIVITDPVYLISLSLMLKLGIFPGYFWVPFVLGNSSWPVIFILSSWQKIAPLFLLSFVLSPLIILAGMLTSLLGGLGGMNQNDYRSLLAYSSLVHTGWMTCLVWLSVSKTIIYMSFYFCAMSVTMLSLSRMSTLSITISKSGSLWAHMLSLAGMPPLLGFCAKFTAMSVLLTSNNYSVLLALLVASSLSLYYYMRVVVTQLLGHGHQANSFLTNTAFTGWIIQLSGALLLLSAINF